MKKMFAFISILVIMMSLSNIQITAEEEDIPRVGTVTVQNVC